MYYGTEKQGSEIKGLYVALIQQELLMTFSHADLATVTLIPVETNQGGIFESSVVLPQLQIHTTVGITKSRTMDFQMVMGSRISCTFLGHSDHRSTKGSWSRS
jgi:predicted Rdx family selenoprotein